LVKTRLLFLAVVTPLGMLGRPLWRRRVGLALSRRAATYWRTRERRPVAPDDLRRGR
jgi:hypothetical protein